jgi:nicotinate dehydrogenase subunit A
MPDTDPMRVTVLVNGRREEVRTERDTALLYVLRNHLGLKGTRFGCGLGLCGACLVLVDGRPAYSCDTPMWAVKDLKVTTVEGLGPPERPHPVAQAIIDGQAAQCGYCISGVVISAAGLLAANDDPSEDEVRAALDRNLCRCGAQNRIVRAVLAAASSLRASRDSASLDGASRDSASRDSASRDID